MPDVQPFGTQIAPILLIVGVLGFIMWFATGGNDHDNNHFH